MKLTIGKRLTLIVGTILTITLVLSAAALYSISRMRRSYDEAVDKTARKITLAGQLDTLSAGLSASTLGYMMYTMTQAQDRAEAARKTFDEDMAALDKGLAEFRTLIDDAECRRLAAESGTGINNWKAAFADLARAVTANKLDEAMRISNERSGPLHAYLAERTQAILARQQKTLNQQRRQMASLESMMTWVTVILLIVSLGAGVFSFVMVLRVSTDLRKIASDLFHNA
ncbi:MAG: MCP four helix bundle domain-containing protein, partial [Bryobacterales bacterium]|nr:MCP four helix bundle domain-containing protein [Bryobacterales bacterium]